MDRIYCVDTDFLADFLTDFLTNFLTDILAVFLIDFLTDFWRIFLMDKRNWKQMDRIYRVDTRLNASKTIAWIRQATSCAENKDLASHFDSHA